MGNSAKVVVYFCLSIYNRKTVVMGETMEEKVANYKTAGFDPRFPQWNQTARCRTNYLDYFRCMSVMKAKEKDTSACKCFKKVYLDVCPAIWVDKWNDEREEGILPWKINVDQKYKKQQQRKPE